MKAIIPCAGFGTRVGMDSNQAKELLTDPIKGKPLIDYSLDLCKKHDLEPLILSRLEKEVFNQYCLSKNLKVFIVPPEGEWTKTVLKSQSEWDLENILILPDTRFYNDSLVIGNMKKDLSNGSFVSLALHKVEDPQNWCIVTDYMMLEKPKINLLKPRDGFHAFGLIAFQRHYGRELFEDLDKSKQHHLISASFQYLDSFRDITRTGKVDEW